MFRLLRRLFYTETGDVMLVDNTGRYRSANPTYFAARLRVMGEDANTSCYLFTLNEMRQGRQRAERNPEDLPFCRTSCRCGTKS